MIHAGEILRANIASSGVYTPVLLGRSPDMSIGVWARMGNLVSFWVHFLWNTGDDQTNTVTISLPFVADEVLPSGSGGSTETMHVGSGWVRSSTSSAAQVVSVRLHSASAVALNQSGTNTTISTPSAGSWTNIRVWGLYLTSASLDALPE